MGDEVDSHYNNTYGQWVKSLNRRAWFPTLATYQGGHVNHYIGAFAGITDIQSMDYYCAGCAPHVTSDSEPMRIQGPHDYLFNTRQNHKPLVTWGYSQAFYSKPLHGNELVVQVASVFAAGCKAIQLFQSDITQKSSNSDCWKDAEGPLASFYAIREYLRIGDVEGAVITNNKDLSKLEMVNIIRYDGVLIVIIINTDCSGYNQVLCTGATHWNWKSNTINTIDIQLPIDFVLNNDIILQEVNNGEIQNSTNGVINDAKITYDKSANSVSLSNVEMGQNPTVVRIFMIPQN
eukprot:285394_1